MICGGRRHADLFVAKERPLLDWGDGMAKSKNKENAIKLPAAVLVNRDTAAQPKRWQPFCGKRARADSGGTAGGAMTAKDFPLRNGQRLRIATVPVKLGDGSPMSAQGVKPDSEVVVSVEEERAYFKDLATLTRTNLSPVSGVFTSVEGTNRRPAAASARRIWSANGGGRI
jgi:hypothetical protein